MPEISHPFSVDPRKPELYKGYPVIERSKQLIEWVSVNVIRFRRNQQVAYRIVDHCRETYNKINDVIDAVDRNIDQDPSYYDKFTQYTNAVKALEAYLFNFLWISDLEASICFANTETILTCIEGANLWADNRKKLREAADEFTADDWLLAMYDPGTRPKMERGFVEAAQDDTIAFHLDLRKEIEGHALVKDKATQARCYFKSGTLVQEIIDAIKIFGDAIARDKQVKRREERETLIIKFLFILHGIMEIVVDTSDKADPDWQAHLKSREVWTASKCVAEHLNLDNTPYGRWNDWNATFDSFIDVISYLPAVRVPQNWVELVKLSAMIRHPYIFRAWEVVSLSKDLVTLFEAGGNNYTLRNVEPLERTIDEAISVFHMATTSWAVDQKYDLKSYDDNSVIVAFTKLESEIREQYRLFKSADELANVEVVQRRAVASDKQRIQMMNEWIDKVMTAEDPTENDELIEVSINSSVIGVPDAKMRVHHTTRLSAIRYRLSRQVIVEADREIVLSGQFEGGYTMDTDLRTISNGSRTCELSFI